MEAFVVGFEVPALPQVQAPVVPTAGFRANRRAEDATISLYFLVPVSKASIDAQMEVDSDSD